MSPASSDLIGKAVTIGFEYGIHKLKDISQEDNYTYSGWRTTYIANCGMRGIYAYKLNHETYRRVVCKTCWPNGIPPKLQYRGTDRTYIWNIGAKTQHIVIEHNRSYCGLIFYDSIKPLMKSKKQVPSLKLCKNCDPTLKLGNIWRQINKL